MKEAMLNYLKKFFEYYYKTTGFLPKVPFDEDLDTKLYVGEIDEEGYIQWMYQENPTKIDFEKVKKGPWRKELWEYVYSYFFLELDGFLDGNLIDLEPINDVSYLDYDLEQPGPSEYSEETAQYMDPIDMKAIENFFYIGNYEGIFDIYFDNDTGNIVTYDFDYHKKTVIADTFQELFERLTPSSEEEE